MRSNQAALLCLITFLAVAAILGGQFVIYRHFEQLRSESSVEGRSLQLGAGIVVSDEPDDPPSVSEIADELLSLDMPGGPASDVRYFPFEPKAEASVPEVGELEVFAEALGDDDVHAGGPELLAQTEPVAAVDLQDAANDSEAPLDVEVQGVGLGDAPERLPAAEDAAPIVEDVNDAPPESLLRALIAKEFPQASAQTQEIWSEELKGLPLEIVRDILRMRQNFGSPPEMPQVPVIITPQPADVQRPPGPPGHDLFASQQRLFDDLAASVPAMVTDIHAAQCVILNNIANAATDGFKRSRVSFEDLRYDHWKKAGVRDEQGQLTATGISVGWGTQLSATVVDHMQGKFCETGQPLHLAIDGPGFFQVLDGSQISYTRCGRFCLDADGNVVLAGANRSRLLEPSMNLPLEAIDIQVSPDGIVSFKLPGIDDRQQAGQIVLAQFLNPAGLEQQGECLFAETPGSGSCILLELGASGRSQLRQGQLEQSNVDIASELAELRRLRDLSEALHSAVQLIEPGGAQPSGESYEGGIASGSDRAPAIAPRLATEAAEAPSVTAQQ